MNYDLAVMARRRGITAETLIPVRRPTLTKEQDLYRILSPIIDHWSKSAGDFAAPFTRDSLDEGMIETHYVAGREVASLAVSQLWQWLSGLDRWQRIQWVQTVRKITGVEIDNLAPALINDEEVRAAARWAVSLIGDLNDDMRKRVETTLRDATAKRLGRRETERLLMKQARLTKKRASLIARDQTQKIGAKMNELQQRAAGIDDYAWQHSFRKNPRRIHVMRQGKRFKWSRPPRDGHPGYAINCRCNAVAILKPQTVREEAFNALG